jgi:uncharacterized protein (UPF0548 family)
LAEWRFSTGWSEGELRDRLERLRELGRNFATPESDMTAARGWTRDGVTARLGTEPPGRPAPGGRFERARRALETFQFSDPRIVAWHFDPATPFAGRNVLLEIKALGLRYLCGVRVVELRSEETEDRTLFGFRIVTLEGHLERGTEWFLLSKDHGSGEVRFRIAANWRLGQFPNLWSHLGFRCVGPAYRKLWRRRAAERLGGTVITYEAGALQA